MAGVVETENVEAAVIILKTIGPTTSISSLRVPSVIKVARLRELVSENRELPVERLRLLLGGSVLHDKIKNEDGSGCENVDEVVDVTEESDTKNIKKEDGADVVVIVEDGLVKSVDDEGSATKNIENEDGAVEAQDELVKFVDGDALIVIVTSTHHENDGWLTEKIFLFLLMKMNIPDILLMPLFSEDLVARCSMIICWFSFAPAPIAFLLTAVWALILLFRVILLYIEKRSANSKKI